RTVEDILSRRTRSLLIDAQVAIEAAPLIADTLKEKLDRDQAWRDRQVADFTAIAQNYLLPS
ncbi:MAG: FAD-dependent oxidoreductase, partial [Verrucomicrobia bacterium]|nr:FAD-dependent oxidoreductase [Verrucomicrobiota bacterium]